jgi:hypothetical protein
MSGRCRRVEILSAPFCGIRASGVRWYEIRRTNGQYSIFQQGTYPPNDGVDRSMGSFAMDWMSSRGPTTAGVDRRLASILRGKRIPCVSIAGYGAKTRYPRRIFETATKLLDERLGASLITIYGDTVCRVEVSSA